jgi:hypothetical protein
LVRSASEEALPVTGAKRKKTHLLDHDKSECPTCRNSDEEEEGEAAPVVFPNPSVDQLDSLASTAARSPSAGSYSRLSDQSRESSRDAVSAGEDTALLQPYPEYKH